MSLNPLAPAFLPLSQSSSDLRHPFCNSTTMCLPLVHLFYEMPPELKPFHPPPINQSTANGTFIVSFMQPKNPSPQDGAAHKLTPGSSALLSSPLHYQTNCLKAIHKTIQQFNQHLKAEHLDRQELQLIVLQLQNDFVFIALFALLR